MTKKNSRKNRKKAKPAGFSNDPFKQLKGSLVCGNDHRAPSSASPTQNRQGSDGTCDLNEGSFLKEMAALGVRRLGPSNDSSEENTIIPNESANGSGRPGPDPDAMEFLEAIGRLDQVFQDQWQEEDFQPPKAQPRRMKQVARGRLRPQAELDLHGLNRLDALHRTRCFLENASHHGLSPVLLITGKGSHSADGPVLSQFVSRQLDELNHLVIEWCAAPRQLGGKGALVVFVRQKKDLKPGQ